MSIVQYCNTLCAIIQCCKKASAWKMVASTAYVYLNYWRAFRGGGEGRGPGLGQGGGGGPRLGGRKESLWPGNRPIPLLLLSPTMRSPLKMWCSALWIVMLYSAMLLAVLPVIVWSELEDNPPGKIKTKCNVLETFAFAARRNEGIYWSLESTSDNFWRKKSKVKVLALITSQAKTWPTPGCI